MLEAPRDPLPIAQELRIFKVSEIRVTADALVLKSSEVARMLRAGLRLGSSLLTRVRD